MKFILVTIGVAALAGGGTFLATRPDAGPQSPLAGDWRCNETVNDLDSSTLLSVASDGALRAQFLLNTAVKDRWVTANFTYTGRIEIEGDQLVEAADNIKLTFGSVDGKPMPESLKTALLAEVAAGSARYHIDKFADGDLVYSDEQGRTICERSPVPLNL